MCSIMASVSDEPPAKKQKLNALSIGTTNLVSLGSTGANGNSEVIPPETKCNFGLKVNDVQSLRLEDGQVVPKFLNNTQRTESLQQLSTNMLPAYSPDEIPPFLEGKGVDNHYCWDCGDSFVCKASLTFHLQRRSVLIRFSCDSCRTIQAFYNRCSLLSHIRAHTDKGEQSDIAKAILSPLPRVLMEGIQIGVMQNLEEEEDSFHNSSYEETVNPSKMLEVSISEGEEQEDSKEPVKHVAVKDTTDVKSASLEEPKRLVKKIRCSECDEEFSDANERVKHFTNNDKVPFMIEMCAKCSILCPTECSLKAHKRLHLQISPYVCPECGDNPDRYWEGFQKHLKYHCLHYARSVGYKCALCSNLFHSCDTLKKHLNHQHTAVLYKCEGCPFAYNSLSNFHNHRKEKHAADISYNQLIKCCICEVVFARKENIEGHLTEHVKDSNCQYTFSCTECGMAQPTKLSLRDHLQKRHGRQYAQHVPLLTTSGTQGKGINVGKSEEQGFTKGRIECLLCHGSFLSKTGYSMHVTKSHSNHKYPCGVCLLPAINRIEMVAHGKEHLKKHTSLCLLCHNKIIKKPQTLDAHLRYHVERVKFQPVCPLCNDGMMTNFEEALEHLRAEHLLPSTAVIPVFSEKELLRITKPDGVKEGSSVRKGESSVEKGIKQKDISEKTNNVASTIKAEIRLNYAENPRSTTLSKRLETGENCCGKCDFKSTDRNEFKTHILSHKESKSSFQCQECGLCYIVEPSLRKHLKIIHKIFDLDSYISEEGTSHTPESETVPEIIKTNELECTVCFEVFTSDAQLKTHMRSHGMAFIQAKKSSLS